MSNFHPDTRGRRWSFTQAYLLSCVVRRGRNTAKKYHWRVWGVLTVCGPHWVCPSSQRRVLSGSTLIGLQGALQDIVQSGPRSKPLRFRFLGCSTKAQTWLGLRFVPFPSPSSSGDQVLGEHTLPRRAVHLITSLVPATRFPGCTAGALSQVCRVSLPGS